MVRALAIASLLLFAIPTTTLAVPNCGLWGTPKSEGKKTRTINGVKHTCDASSQKRSCCDLGQQTKCWTETQTTYDNCTPTRTSPAKTQTFKLQTPGLQIRP
jgi:hypothetical protein